MQLVMDGVVRRGGVINLAGTMAASPVAMRPMPIPSAALPAGAVGLDGVRRRVMPTAAVAAPAAVAAVAPATLPFMGAAGDEGLAAATRPWLRSVGQGVGGAWQYRGVQMAAFSLVATGLVAGSVAVGHNLQLQRTTAGATPAGTAAAATSSAAASTASLSAASARAVAAQQAALGGLLADFTAAHGPAYSLFVKDLKTGAIATINPDAAMTSASLYKLFVAQQIYRQVDSGKLVYAGDAGGGSGRTVEQCLAIMINISDNTCGRALGSILDWQAQDQALKDDGYTGTTLATPQQTSPRDVAQLLERLYAGTLLTPDSTQRLMALLKDQRVNDRLPTGVPAGTVVAHKTGDLDGYMHDAGIISGPKTDYLVVAMGAPGAKAADFTDLSSRLWQFFEN